MSIDHEDDGLSDQFDRDCVDFGLKGHGAVLANFTRMARMEEFIETTGKGAERPDSQ